MKNGNVDIYEALFRASVTARLKTINRRNLVMRGAILGGSVTVFGIGGNTAAQETTPGATPVMFRDAVDVLNYALTLEHIETAFYRDGLAQIGRDGITSLGLDASVFDSLGEIGAHEAAHVETLTNVIIDLGGEPATEGTYDFGYEGAAEFLATAQALEDTGVSAYTGAARFLIENDELLTAALTIHGVEARHASWLALLNATNPFPDAFNPDLAPEEVLEIANPFIISTSTPEADQIDEVATAVEIIDFAFEPAELEIATGTKVTWTNSGGQPHTATAEDGSFDTGVLTTGKSASYTFTEPGTYAYVCTLHENTMQAVLVVT